MNRLKEVL